MFDKKHLFRLGLPLIILMLCVCTSLKAQSTVMNVMMNDGTSQSFVMSDADRVYFLGNTYLIVEEADNANITSIRLDDIRKITCSEVEGVTEDLQPAVSILPNPTRNVMMLHNLEGSQEVKIYALSGQLVKSLEASSGQPIDVSDLSAGVYMVRTQSCTLKMMKL